MFAYIHSLTHQVNGCKVSFVNSSTVTRERNRRGEGGKLRADILEAAIGLLAETGNEESITLRAVARRIGISPPSIYAHFEDREAIVEEIVRVSFGRLTEVLIAARDAESDPIRQLRAGCQAYLDFSVQHPDQYRILFHCPMLSPRATAPTVEELVGSQAFLVLVNGIAACAEAGRSDSTDPFLDAVALWTALHGYATLRSDSPNFPWPPHEAILEALIAGLGRTSR
jgi:AcrR family transcriptional regulator